MEIDNSSCYGKSALAFYGHMTKTKGWPQKQ